MSSDTDSKEVTESTNLPADVTDDDSCRLEFIEIVPLTRDTDGPCTTECDSGDWSAEVKQENLPVVKQEPDDDVWWSICCLSCVQFCLKISVAYFPVSDEKSKCCNKRQHWRWPWLEYFWRYYKKFHCLYLKKYFIMDEAAYNVFSPYVVFDWKDRCVMLSMTC